MNGIEGPRVIHIDGELYYHSEWLKTRHEIIKRLEEQNEKLLTKLEKIEQELKIAIAGDGIIRQHEEAIVDYEQLRDGVLKVIEDNCNK